MTFSADAVRSQCSDLLWDIAPHEPGETVKRWLHRAAVVTGLKTSLIKRIRYQEIPSIPAHIADQLRDAAAKQQAMRVRSAALKAENEQMLDAIRKGHPLAVRSAAMPLVAGSGGLDATAPAGEDPRQMSLGLSGWMRR